MSYESVSFTEIKTGVFETQQLGNGNKSNPVIPESDENPQTEQQVYSCFTFVVAFVLRITCGTLGHVAMTKITHIWRY